MLYLVNPARKAKSRKTTRRKPSRKQLAARRKFAAMAKARAKAARNRKRATTRRNPTMAVRRRKRATTARRRPRRRRNPMASVRRRGKAVSRRAWRASGYRRNPVRRRRSYRRNPGRMMRGVLGQTMDLVQASGAALVGAAVGRTVTNLIPLNGSPVINFAKGAAVAIAIRTFGERLVGRDVARFAAVGAMIGPTKDLIVSFVPQAEAFLGRADGVTFLPRSYTPALNAYGGDVASERDIQYDTGSSNGFGLGSYTDY